MEDTSYKKLAMFLGIKGFEYSVDIYAKVEEALEKIVMILPE